MVAVLKKSLEGADVSLKSSLGQGDIFVYVLAAQPAVLWSSWDWQDVGHIGHVSRAVWTRTDETASAGTERL